MKIGDLPTGAIWWLEDGFQWKKAGTEGRIVHSIEAHFLGHGVARTIDMDIDDTVANWIEPRN